jgi:hypothetical protein
MGAGAGKWRGGPGSIVIRALSVVAVLLLAGCLQIGSDAPDAALAPTPAEWLDIQADPADYSGSEVSMAVKPTEALHIIAAAHAGGFGVYASYDGGATWTAERLITQSLFGVAEGAPGTAVLLSDPAVAFSPNGALHIARLAHLPASAVFVATHGGAGCRVDTV